MVVVGVDGGWRDGDPVVLPQPEWRPANGQRTVERVLVLVGVAPARI